MMEAAEARTASVQTRARLLDAARQVFSQRGFQGATVREICRRAEANGAAVNYHFGSKDGLLAEALNFAPLAALQKVNASESPKVRLRLFIRDFMLMLLDEKNPSSQCRILARELVDPTPALDKIVREAIAPLHEFLGKLVRRILDDSGGGRKSWRDRTAPLRLQHPWPVFVLPPFAPGAATPASRTTTTRKSRR